MFYAISWFLALALLALWSMACWGVHAVTVWAVSGAGGLATGAPTAMEKIAVPDWLAVWLPPALSQEFGVWIASAGPVVQSVLEAVPALSGAISVLAWAVWGLGAVVLVVLAVAAHVLIRVLQRSKRGATAPKGVAA